MTLATFLLDEWLPAAKARIKPSTWDSFDLTTRKYIVPRLGSIEVQGLTPGRVRAFYSELLIGGGANGRPFSPKTVHNVYAVLHAALADAVALGYVPINVASSKLAPPPTGDRPEMKVWSPAELGAFLDHVAQDRLYAAWLLFATTGLRRGELLGLRWTDVDLDTARIAIRSNRVRAAKVVVAGTPKTKKGTRPLALDPDTLAALREWRKRQLEERLLIGSRYVDSGLVFTYPDGSPILPNRISIWFRAHVRRSGLPTIRLHDVRHSYATAALDAGVPVKVVSERLGHANVQITMDTYQHVLPGMDESAAATVAALFVRSRSTGLAVVEGGA
jgi:integrase